MNDKPIISEVASPVSMDDIHVRLADIVARVKAIQGDALSLILDMGSVAENIQKTMPDAPMADALISAIGTSQIFLTQLATFRAPQEERRIIVPNGSA